MTNNRGTRVSLDLGPKNRSFKDILLGYDNSSVPNADKGPIALCGWLWKMKRNGKMFLPGMNRRWFSVEGSELKYYNSNKSTEPSGTISLLSITSIRKFADKNSDSKLFNFVIQSESRSFFLSAETESDMNRWVKGLRLQQELWQKKLDKNAKTDQKSGAHKAKQKKETKQRSPSSLDTWRDFDAAMEDMDKAVGSRSDSEDEDKHRSHRNNRDKEYSPKNDGSGFRRRKERARDEWSHSESEQSASSQEEDQHQEQRRDRRPREASGRRHKPRARLQRPRSRSGTGRDQKESATNSSLPSRREGASPSRRQGAEHNDKDGLIVEDADDFTFSED